MFLPYLMRHLDWCLRVLQKQLQETCEQLDLKATQGRTENCQALCNLAFQPPATLQLLKSQQAVGCMSGLTSLSINGHGQGLEMLLQAYRTISDSEQLSTNLPPHVYKAAEGRLFSPKQHQESLTICTRERLTIASK